MRTTPDDIVPDDARRTGARARGCRRPNGGFIATSTARAADANAIVHTHAPFATTLACHSRGIPAFHYMVAVAGGRDIRCAPYATFGTQALSDHVVAALDGRRACLLAHHGMIAVGASLPEALALAVEVETLAEIYWRALSIGEPAAARRRRDGRRARQVRDVRAAAAQSTSDGSPGGAGARTTSPAAVGYTERTSKPGEPPCPIRCPLPRTRDTEICLLPALANRHGLITGATGTGKTVTLQVMAERFSRIGVPVFMADVKGDLSGITQPGAASPKLARAPEAHRR